MTWGDHVRTMTSDDVSWVVEMTRQRRESLVTHAPLFWRPAEDATDRHRAFLAQLIDDPDVLSVRTANGYLIAVDRGPAWLVDDATVAGEGEWEVEGVALLRHAQQRCGPLRVVVPVFESSRMAAVLSVGLAPIEQWWHRDLAAAPATAVGAADGPDIAVDGAHGQLVPAPPVYDPGGPVLLVTDVREHSALRRIEAEAAARGATVAVVTQRPDDSALEELLVEAGYVRTTAFCGAGLASR